MALPVYTNDQIANQLTTAFWNFVGVPPSHWNIATGGSLTVNITALTAGGQFFAQAALKTWSESTGINFVYTAGPAQITFDDADPNSAYEFHTIVNGFITSASINISTDWIAGDLGNLNSYSYQTYLHEIGHALGLGHAGNYNGDAMYGVNNQYLNDSWQTSVMSYFSQDDNTYVNADFAFITTPMVADVIAVNSFYGAATATRTGNTTYGFNSNAGNVIFDATQFPDVSYAIVDNGGTDTLDYSGFTQGQLIDLSAEAFSNIGGVAGNVTIARGSTIENAIGGSGNDSIFGNSVSNFLQGNFGSDSLDGGDGLLLSSSQATIYRLYQATLDREPELAGLNFHVNNLVNGVSLQSIASNFVNSDEFTSKYGSLDNSHFVTQLYANVLHRLPDAPGFAYWTNLLNGGATRASVLLGFSESAEFTTNTYYDTEAYATDVFGTNHIGEIFRLYGSALGRTPDVSGIQFHLNAMINGLSIDTVASNFLNSPEFQSVYGSLDNEQFVTLLYNNVLNRAPDAPGLAYWLAGLDGGATRVSVLLGFSESQEFVNNTSASLHSFIDNDMAAIWSDRVDGGSGNDILFGGLGSDTFAFSANMPGADQVYGLDDFDQIEFAGFGYSSQLEVFSHITQVGADVVFSDQGETITFHHSQLATLQAPDIFVFV